MAVVLTLMGVAGKGSDTGGACDCSNFVGYWLLLGYWCL